MTSIAATRSNDISSIRAWLMVSMLSALYFVSFVDRAILALVVGPLKADLGVTDVELGILFGPAFAVFFALLGLPFAYVADRGNRTRLVVAGALVWGLCTLGSGLVHSYGLLVALRGGLAIGEAALTPAAYSLIGAIFPPDRRVRAASIYSAIGVAGVAGAYIVGALAIAAAQSSAAGVSRASAHGFASWQLVFFIVGVPAIVGALLFAAVAREPARSNVPATNSLSRVWQHIQGHGAMYPALFCGAGILQTISYSYAAWGPEHLHRTFGLQIQSAGAVFGLSGMLGATLGTLLVPAIARAWQVRGRHDAIALTAMCAAVLGGTAAVAAPLARSVDLFTLWYAVTSFGLFGASTGLVVSMQVLAPLQMRATLVAILLLCMTLLGGFLGPPLVALIATSRSGSGAHLGEAISLVSAGAVCLGVMCLAIARRPLQAYVRAHPTS